MDIWITSIILIIYLVSVNGLANSRIINENVILHSSDEFFKHEIIKPTLEHRRHKKNILDTRTESGFHADELILSYIHCEKHVIIDLKLNDKLIPQGHFMRYQLPNGTDAVQHFTKTDIDLCHYKGTIRNNKESHVAISTCHGIKGVINDGDETYYIDTKHNGSISDEHFLYRHSDRIQKTSTCGNEKHGDVSEVAAIGHKNIEINRISRFKRSEDAVIRGPYNANRHSSFVELVLVVDNKVYKSLGQNLKNVHSHCKDIANIINALYVPLNIFIALVGIVVWNENNEVKLSSDGDKTLRNFLHYRRKVLSLSHPNDHAHLLTNEKFEGGVVGKAYKGAICTYQNSGGVSRMDHSKIFSIIAATVAHEMGHNFGMDHDKPDCKCKEDRCIMSSSISSVTPFHWSSCSIDQLNLALHRGINYCLRNKPTQLFDIDSPQCGNGFVEPGEQCDCGLPEFCQNSCCNPKTCMLHSNATCATGECCDLATCHPRTAGTVCRTADGECDLPEYCTGESEYCPQNYFKRDTELCDEGKAYCYEGACRSHTNQCKLLWGSSGYSVDACYKQNMNGNRFGNCGYDRLNNVYKKCLEGDSRCGTLQCENINASFQFEFQSAAESSHSYADYDKDIRTHPSCREATIDVGLQSADPGLTPDGAMCGEEKMCIRQRCMSVKSLRDSGIGVECPENCNGHGKCDNKGKCHCDDGFTPPLCEPADDGGTFVIVLITTLVGVVLFILLVTLLLCYLKRKKNTALQQIQYGNTGASDSTDEINSSLLKSDRNIVSNGINNYSGPISGTLLGRAPNVEFDHLKIRNVPKMPIAAPNRPAPQVPKPPNDIHRQIEVKEVVNHFNVVLPSKFSSEIASAVLNYNLKPDRTKQPLISRQLNT